MSRAARWYAAVVDSPAYAAVRAAVLPRAHATLARLRQAGHTGARTWRRSLQLRIVSLTLLISALLVLAFGWLLASRITAGLVASRRDAAKVQLDQGLRYVENQLATRTDPQDPGLNAAVKYAASLLVPGPPSTDTYYVVLQPTDGNLIPVKPKTAPDVTADQSAAGAERWVPADLHRIVAGGTAGYEYTRANPDGKGLRPYVVVGTPVPLAVGQFELYYLFPMDAEVTNAATVRTTVVVTGVALVLLLALVAALVTHLVVRPVRLAARTAQRLSAGLLDQRMVVRGEDDLARLAASFNQMAANLQRQINRLEEMSRLQRRFTSDVSHELRTPLTTVRMAADLLFASREDFDPAAARSAELLQAELDRFEELLTDLLEISRFDAGFAALDAEAVDLVAVVERVVDGLAPLAERVGVPVETELPAGPVVAEVDPRRVERILRNLVGNAVEHGEHRPVRVMLAAADGAAAVTVRDHGVGLNAGEEKLVFNRFWRADPSRARQTGGTGLGLSISIEDARLHGGWLEAWGAPGLGAQFRVTLPLRAGDRLTSSPLPLVPADAEPELGPVPPDEPVPLPGRRRTAQAGTGAAQPGPVTVREEAGHAP